MSTATIGNQHYQDLFDQQRVPAGTRTPFSNSHNPVSTPFDGHRVIAGSRDSSPPAPLETHRFTVSSRDSSPQRVPVGNRVSFDATPSLPVPVGNRASFNNLQTNNLFAVNLPSVCPLNLPQPIPAYIPSQNDSDNDWVDPMPAYIPTQNDPYDSTYDLPPFPYQQPQDTLSSDEASGQDPQSAVNGEFSDHLDPIVKIQKKMKLASIALAAGGIALAILGIVIIATGSGVGLLPIFVALPLLYIGYNGYRVSENLARIIKKPDQVISSDDVIQIDSQKIKQGLKEKTLFFDWAIDKGTDYLLKTPAPAA